MPNFVARVGTTDGQILERSLSAATADAARNELQRQGLHIFQLKRSGLSIEGIMPSSRRVVSTDRFLLFNQELLALVRAGLPILHSFDVMLERQKDARFRRVLEDIREKIKSGVALSDAFADYGSAFPPIYATSIRAGERSGDLEGVLKRFLRYQKLIVSLRKKVIGALVYPTILVLLSIGMIAVMLVFVIPKFSEFFIGFGTDLPIFTRTLIEVAFFVRTNALAVTIALAAIVFFVRRWQKSESGGNAFDYLKMRIPLVGGVLRRFAILQFTQSLGTLLAGGTPMVPALEIASQSISNRHVSSRINSIAQDVREGEPLWKSLDNTGVMSDLAVEMIKVGESTGALVDMLANVSEFYDEEIEAMLNRLIALIEPLILVFLGVVIAVLLYAFYLPLFELSKAGG